MALLASTRFSGLARVALVIGTAGLVIAMGTDTLAVLGRHAGVSLPGALEIVQVAIALLASAAMVLGTASGTHASVHIVTDRLPRPLAALLARVSALVSGVVVLMLAGGTFWVLLETWGGNERSELLHIPLHWFRIVLLLALLVVTALFLAAVFRRGDRS